MYPSSYTVSNVLDNTSRRIEIERKRERLEELRRARQDRVFQSTSIQYTGVPTNVFAVSRKEVDELVESLIGPIKPVDILQPPPENVTPTHDTKLDTNVDVKGDTKVVDLSDNANQSKNDVKNVSVDPLALEIAKEEKVLYTKEVQTDDTFTSHDASTIPSPHLHHSTGSTLLGRKKSEISLGRRVSALDMKSGATVGMHVAVSVVPALTVAAAAAGVSCDGDDGHPYQRLVIPEEPDHPTNDQHELTDQDRTALLETKEFRDFFDKSTKFVERALATEYDICMDYSEETDVIANKDNNEIKCIRSFMSDKHTKNRMLTDTDWSTHYPELILGSYNKNTSNMNDPDGLVLIWNLHLSDRPEYVFQSQPDVMSSCFSPFHSNLVIGGTYSGQIVIWDTRTHSPMPVLKTSLSVPGHSHPVYTVTVTGTQNAHNLVSASNDGTVCTWHLDMLSQPQEMIEMTYPGCMRTDEVGITCMSAPVTETSTFWIGTEEGTVYQCNRYDRAGCKAGIDTGVVYGGHGGMVTGIEFHSGVGGIELQDLFLTSSVDWTVKLWKAQTTSSVASVTGVGVVSGGGGGGVSGTGSMGNSGSVNPVHSFDDAQDYVMDISWSPTHPAMFGSVDGTGRFNLYNLAVSDIPIAGDVMGNRKGLNKIDWCRDGRRVGLASSDGCLYVYDVGRLHQPHADDGARMHALLRDFATETR